MPGRLEIIWLLNAEASFQEIYNWISNYSEQRAEQFYHSTNSVLDQASVFPEMGHNCGKDIRRILALGGRYGIFYRTEPTRLVVLGIEDLRQDSNRIKRNLGMDD